jgi:glycosyltransferase involved in cell wall biosynthesis
MSEFVAELGIGRAFVSEDVDSLAEAISDVIARRDDYRAVYEERPEILETYSWRSERRKLFHVYRGLLGVDNVGTDIEDELLPSLTPVRGREST